MTLTEPSEENSAVLPAVSMLRALLRLALPVLLANFLHVLVEYVDTFLAGRFLKGPAPLAAISLIRYAMWLVFTLFAFVSIGATALIARFVGAGDMRHASRTLCQSLLLGLGLSLIFMVLGFAGAKWLTGAMHLEGEAARLALVYLYYVLPVLPALMIEEVGVACLRGAGDTVSGLVIMGIVNVVNLVVSATLLIGWGPIPALGWPALAIGTVTARLMGAAIMLALLARGRAGLKITLADLKPDGEMLARLLRIGVPGGVDAIAVVGCHFWYVSIITRLGTMAAAAHALGISIEALSYLPGSAFQVAAATMVGQSLGAKDQSRATRSALAACAMAGTFMTACGLLFFFAPRFLVTIFLGENDPQLTDLCVRLLPIVAISMPALAICMTMSGSLRGAGDTRWPLGITLLGFLCVRIPLAYVLSQDTFFFPGTSWELHGYGWGVAGAWMAMVADVYVRALLVSIRFFQGGWKKIEV
jgi:putative MATE family efflux protein